MARLERARSLPLRARQDLDVRRQILTRRRLIVFPPRGHVRRFWQSYHRAYTRAYGIAIPLPEFRPSGERLADYPAADRGACILYSGGVESTYMALKYPHATRLTIDDEAPVHPRGAEMFIRARAQGFARIYYGGNEPEWGSDDNASMRHPKTGSPLQADAFEFNDFREGWMRHLGVKIVFPTEGLYKDQIIKRIYDADRRAYARLQSCFLWNKGWCGGCDKCLVIGSIIEALGLPRLFRMRESEYSRAIVKELPSYRTGDYDRYERLPMLRRLEEVFGYQFRVGRSRAPRS